MKILCYKKQILSIFCIIGRQYDKEGNMKQWWKNETINAFRTRAQCIVDQYSGYKLEQIGLNVGIYCMYYKLCKKHQQISSIGYLIRFWLYCLDPLVLILPNTFILFVFPIIRY